MTIAMLRALLATLVGLTLAVGAEPQQRVFTCQLKKDNDRVKTIQTPEVVTFDVHSADGIGGMEVTRTAGTWPDRVVIRVDFQTLEGFIVDNGRMRLAGGVGSTEKKRVHHFDRDGQHVEDASKAVFTMIAERKGLRRIEVQLPAGFCAPEAKKLKVEWIDAFRG